MSEHEPSQNGWLRRFAALHWYEATLTFLFNFVAKTSELLLTAGVVVSTANFLTDGHLLRTNQPLSLAWSWAQAIAIDASLGVVCRNTLVAWREREYVKATVYALLTLLLGTVAGLMTHFEVLAQAAGLPVTDQRVSGIIPLWVMSALRAVAVIGLLVASRLSQVSLRHQELKAVSSSASHARSIPEERSTSAEGKEAMAASPALDQQHLSAALLSALQQAGITSSIRITEEPPSQVALPGSPGKPSEPASHYEQGATTSRKNPSGRFPELVSAPSEGPVHAIRSLEGHQTVPSVSSPCGPNDERQPTQESEPASRFTFPCRGAAELSHGNQPSTRTEPVVTATTRPRKTGQEERLHEAYCYLQAEGLRVSGTALASRAGVRKQTALDWLQRQGTEQSNAS